MAPKLKCLVIEDSLFDQKMIERTIAGARIDADLAFVGSLHAARNALVKQSFAIILCDNNLPDGNGAEFAFELARIPKLRHTDIVIVSGWPSPFMWAKARAVGLQIIDKNDQPQARLIEIFNQKRKRTGKTHHPAPNAQPRDLP